MPKQARKLSDVELGILLEDAARGRNPTRDRAIILLSFKAGLRAKEIAMLSWSMVTDASGNLADDIALPNSASKGDGGGRTIPIHPLLKSTLKTMMDDPPRRFARPTWPRPDDPVVPSAQGRYSPNAIAVWFHIRYRRLNLSGASSHSGRRTFITNAARQITQAGGSIVDVQMLAGHSSLSMTQKYIDSDSAVRRRLVGLL